MTSSTLLYFISILLTFALTGLLAWYAWRQRPVLPGVRMYAWLALAESLLSLDEIFSMISATLVQAHFFFNMRFLFTGIISVFFLVFALEYLGSKDWITRPLLSAVFIIPALSQLFIWIPGLNGLWVKQDVGFRQSGPFWVSDTSLRIPGVWFLVNSFYGLALLLAGIVLILLVAWRQRRQQRGQALLLAGGAMVALVTALIPVLNLFPQLAFNPFILGIGISAGLYALAVFRFQFLKRSPAQESPGFIDIPRLEENHSLAAFIFVFILFATGIAAIGVVSYQKYEEQFRLQVNDQLTAVAALKVNQLESWRTERLGDANMFTLNPDFSALVQQYYANPADTQVQFQLQAWLADFQSYYHYVNVFLLDAHGVEQVSAPAGHQLFSAYLAGQASAALGSGQATFVDFYRDASSGPIRLALLAPIYAGGLRSHPLGVVVLSIDPEVLLYPFIQEWPTPSTTAETLLVRRNGDNVLFLNPLKFNRNAALNMQIPLVDTQVLAVKAVQGQAGVVEGIDYRSQSVVGYVGAVPGSPWFLVARMDTAEVYAPLRQRLWEMLVFFGVLILAAGAGLLLLWRQQGVRYYRGQLAAAQQLRDSEARYRRLFEAARDGILILDAETGVVLDVNPFLIEMLGFPAAEILGKELWQLGFFKDIAANKANFLELQKKEYIRYDDLPLETVHGRTVHVEFVSNVYHVDHHKVVQCNIRDITERKRTEDVLRETNEYLENLFNYANAPIIVWDPTFRITRFNHAFESLTGRSATQVLGQPLDLLFPSEQVKASMPLIQKTLTGERWEVVEINIQHVDGSIRTVLWNSATLFSADGQTPLATIAQGQDITERKQSQNILQARLRLVEFAANHTLSELLTQTLDEVCAITASPIGFYDFVEPDQQTLSHQTWSTRTLQEYCQAQSSGEHFSIADAGVWVDCIRQRKPVIHNDYASLPHRMGLPAGHAALLRELVVPIFRDDLIVAILGIGNRAQEYTEEDIKIVTFFADVAWEIARRKRAEETLHESEERFHSLFENMLNGFAYCRMLIEEDRPPDFIYLEVNGAFGTLTGLKDVVGKKASEAIPGIQASDPELLERYARVSRTGVPKSFETYVESMQMWFSISVYSPQQGYFVAVFDVITDRKLAEQELQAYSEYLEDMVNERTRALQDAQEKMVRTERLATLGQLAGSVGHELRNPLGVISNAVYFLKMTQPDASPTILDYLDIIDKETRISDKIVTDLLDFTRIKSVDRESAAVSDLFTQTLQRYHVPSAVEVSLQLPPDLPPVFADPRQVVQVLGNLVTNACQAMLESQTGSTTLSAPDEAPRAGKLTLTASLQGDMIAIAVQDTGMGIPPENMGKLFEPLFTTKTKGIGLGLAVSQKLTGANGGRIEVHSQPGQGSTFTVYLPAYRLESESHLVE